MKPISVVVEVHRYTFFNTKDYDIIDVDTIQMHFETNKNYFFEFIRINQGLRRLMHKLFMHF